MLVTEIKKLDGFEICTRRPAQMWEIKANILKEDNYPDEEIWINLPAENEVAVLAMLLFIKSSILKLVNKNSKKTEQIEICTIIEKYNNLFLNYFPKGHSYGEEEPSPVKQISIEYFDGSGM